MNANQKWLKNINCYLWIRYRVHFIPEQPKCKSEPPLMCNKFETFHCKLYKNVCDSQSKSELVILTLRSFTSQPCGSCCWRGQRSFVQLNYIDLQCVISLADVTKHDSFFIVYTHAKAKAMCWFFYTWNDFWYGICLVSSTGKAVCFCWSMVFILAAGMWQNFLVFVLSI